MFQPTGDNSSAIINLVCDPAKFADFFSVPADTQINDLSSAVCNMISDGGAELTDELQRSWQIDTLIQKVSPTFHSAYAVESY